MNKYAKNAVKASIPIALIGALAFAVPIFANEEGKNVTFENTAEIKGDVSYSPIEAPNGFSLVAGRSVENISPLQAMQNPGSWLNAEKTCKFTPTITSLPVSAQNREEEFLSKQYLYGEAERYESIPSETKKASINSTAGELATVYASYNVPNNGSLGTDMNSGDYYRTTVTRAIASPVNIPSTSNSPGSKDEQGLPVLVFNYDCAAQDDYRENELKQMLDAIKVDFESSHSSEIPTKKDKEGKSEVADDPSDDIEDGYTIIQDEFENPSDVIDRGTSRGATDNATIAPDPVEPVQVTEPAWKQ